MPDRRTYRDACGVARVGERRLIIGLIGGRVSLAEAEAARDVVVTGHRDIPERFLGLLPLPTPSLAT